MSAGTVLMVVTVYSESDPEQLAKRFARLAYLECGERAEVGIIDHAATGKIILVPPAEPVWPNSGADAIDENPPEPQGFVRESVLRDPMSYHTNSENPPEPELSEA